MNDYQVIVSNVGTVYDGNDKAEANAAYVDYKVQSRRAMGRAAGEDVTLMFKGEPYKEFIGAISEAHNNADKEGCKDSACVPCKLRRALEAELHKRTNHKDGELGYIVDIFIGRINKVRGIEIEEQQREPLYKALIEAITSNTNGG